MKSSAWLLSLKYVLRATNNKYSQFSAKKPWRHCQTCPNGRCVQCRKFLFNFCCLSFLCFKFSHTRLEHSRTISKTSSHSSQDPKDREKHRVRAEIAQIEVKTRFNKWPQFSSLRRQAIYSICSRSRKRKAIFLSSRPLKQTLRSFNDRPHAKPHFSPEWPLTTPREQEETPSCLKSSPKWSNLPESSSQIHAREWRK